MVAVSHSSEGIPSAEQGTQVIPSHPQKNHHPPVSHQVVSPTFDHQVDVPHFVPHDNVHQVLVHTVVAPDDPEEVIHQVDPQDLAPQVTVPEVLDHHLVLPASVSTC